VSLSRRAAARGPPPALRRAFLPPRLGLARMRAIVGRGARRRSNR